MTLTGGLHWLQWGSVGESGDEWIAMPLTGTYPRTLDDKRRIALPRRLKDDLHADDGTVLFLAPGVDRSLSLYTSQGFETQAALLAHRSPNDASVRAYQRLFYGQAERVDLDKQARFCIPDRLADFAGLERDVVLLGVHDHVELWDQRLWEQYFAQQAPAFDRIAGEAYGASAPQ